MLLGSQGIGTTDVRRCSIDYGTFLEKGEIISLATVSVPAGTVSSVGGTSRSPDDKRFIFYVTAGSVNETFTASIQITTSLSQVINDTMRFTVVAP